MSVIVLDEKRIFLNGIGRYEIDSEDFYYRNDNAEERLFFIFRVINQDELWSEYNFKYLSIKMFDGKTFNFYSDSKLKNLMKRMEKYFEEHDIDLDEEVPEEEEDLKKAVESYKNIKDTFKYIDAEIAYIASKLDSAFGTI